MEGMRKTIHAEFQDWATWAEEKLCSQAVVEAGGCGCECNSQLGELQKDTQALLRRMGEVEQKTQLQAGKLAQQAEQLAARPPPTVQSDEKLEEAVEKLEEDMKYLKEQLPKVRYLIRKETRAIMGPNMDVADDLLKAKYTVLRMKQAIARAQKDIRNLE